MTDWQTFSSFISLQEILKNKKMGKERKKIETAAKKKVEKVIQMSNQSKNKQGMKVM